jgi:acyl transferase domain-containing protein
VLFLGFIISFLLLLFLFLISVSYGLEESVHALEDACINLHSLESDAEVGVFFATDTSHYLLHSGVLQDEAYRANPILRHQVRMGNMTESASTLAAFKLGLTGPVYGVQSACSSSLVSVHVGASAILRYAVSILYSIFIFG